MWLPFRDEVDEVFRRDRSLGLKVAGAAAVTAFVVVGRTLRGRAENRLEFPLTTPALILLGVGSAILGACLALALSLRDAVRAKLDRGARVHPVLALVFGSRAVGVAILAILIAGAIFYLLD